MSAEFGVQASTLTGNAIHPLFFTDNVVQQINDGIQLSYVE